MRYAYRTVDIADIEYFDTEYISLFALASKMGVDPRRSQCIVRQADVRPKFKPPTAPATFYQRGEVAHLLP